MNLLNGVHHINLKAPGYDCWRGTLAFYTETMGLPLVRRWGEGDGSGAMIDLGGCLLELMATGEAEPGIGRFTHIAFRTDSADAALELARSAGRPVLMEPTDVNPDGSYPLRVAFCQGVAGEEIEFFQER